MYCQNIRRMSVLASLLVLIGVVLTTMIAPGENHGSLSGITKVSPHQEGTIGTVWFYLAAMAVGGAAITFSKILAAQSVTRVATTGTKWCKDLFLACRAASTNYTHKKEKLLGRKSAVVFALTVLVSGFGTMAMSTSAFADQNRVEMASRSKVSIDRVIQTASEQVSGTVVHAELLRSYYHHHELMWEVVVVRAEDPELDGAIDNGRALPVDKEMIVHVDAKTGTVIDVQPIRKPTRLRELSRPES